MSRPLLALVSIVKDEAACIVRTLESVRGVVDRATVLDTGSTDGTREVVQAAFVRLGIRGDNLAGTFLDYAQARNDALDAEGRSGESATYALSLSADEVLHGGDRLRAFLQSYDGEEDAFLVEIRTPNGSFNYPRVLRVGGAFRYEGEIHEQPVHQLDHDRKPAVKIPGCFIEYAPTDPERLGRRLRERDLPLLLRQLAGAKGAAARARTVLLLAQTREQIASTIKDDVASASQEMFSALGWYALLSMDGEAPEEARRHAAWRYLNIAEMLGIYLPQELVPRLAHALQQDPGNPAIAYMLARHTADPGEDGQVRGDARAGMAAAQRAAKIARDAAGSPPHDPHGLLWRSHFIAALCAKALGHGPAAKVSAKAGIEGGGPAEAFEQFLK